MFAITKNNTVMRNEESAYIFGTIKPVIWLARKGKVESFKETAAILLHSASVEGHEVEIFNFLREDGADKKVYDHLENLLEGETNVPEGFDPTLDMVLREALFG